MWRPMGKWHRGSRVWQFSLVLSFGVYIVPYLLRRGRRFDLVKPYRPIMLSGEQKHR